MLKGVIIAVCSGAASFVLGIEYAKKCIALGLKKMCDDEMVKLFDENGKEISIDDWHN